MHLVVQRYVMPWTKGFAAGRNNQAWRLHVAMGLFGITGAQEAWPLEPLDSLGPCLEVQGSCNHVLKPGQFYSRSLQVLYDYSHGLALATLNIQEHIPYTICYIPYMLYHLICTYIPV